MMINLFNINILNNNLNILRRHKHLSKKDFNRLIGVENAFRTDFSSIGPKLLKGIELNFPGINEDWLLTSHDVNYDVSVDLIKTSHDTGSIVNEPQAPYNGDYPATNTPHHSESLLNLTADVLSTDSVYRDALTSNVKAFHDAVSARKQLAVSEAKLIQCQRENIELKQQLNEKNNLIENLQAMISELRSGKSGAGGA